MREMGYLRYDKIYSGNTRLKKSQKAGQKQTPQEISGDLFITGGVGTFDGIRYDKYRVFAGNPSWQFIAFTRIHAGKAERILVFWRPLFSSTTPVLYR